MTASRVLRGPHPGIRILCLLLLAAGLPPRPLLDLLLLSFLLALGYAACAPRAFQLLARGVWRLRWLLGAILVLYWGFTPGEPLLAWAPGLSREGILEGTRRALVLLCLLAAVYLLMATTPLPRLLLGLRWLLRPLALLGLDADRFSLRLALALEAATQTGQTLAPAARSREQVLDAAASLVLRIENAAATPAPAWSLPPEAAPRWWEWLLPLALLPLSLGWAL